MQTCQLSNWELWKWNGGEDGNCGSEMGVRVGCSKRKIWCFDWSFSRKWYHSLVYYQLATLTLFWGKKCCLSKIKLFYSAFENGLPQLIGTQGGIHKQETLISRSTDANSMFSCWNVLKSNMECSFVLCTQMKYWGVEPPPPQIYLTWICSTEACLTHRGA